jgi:hypothetical protein
MTIATCLTRLFFHVKPAQILREQIHAKRKTEEEDRAEEARLKAKGIAPPDEKSAGKQKPTSHFGKPRCGVSFVTLFISHVSN